MEVALAGGGSTVVVRRGELVLPEPRPWSRPVADPLWAVVWRVRGTAWMLRHRRLLEQTLG